MFGNAPTFALASAWYCSLISTVHTRSKCCEAHLSESPWNVPVSTNSLSPPACASASARFETGGLWIEPMGRDL